MSIKVIKNFDTLKCSVLGKSIPIDHLGFTLFLGLGWQLVVEDPYVMWLQYFVHL